MDQIHVASVRQIFFYKIGFRDAILIIICALSVYLLRARDTFLLLPAWHLRPGQQNSDLLLSYLPKPVVTDLDGDGVMEIVFVTRSHELQVCTISARHIFPDETLRQLPEPIVKRSVTISSYVMSDGNVSYPVGLEIGYLSAPLSVSDIRTQVIVLVLDNWMVLCFDHQLNLLWSQTIANITQTPGAYFVKSIAIMVISNSLNQGQTGLILFGGSRGQPHNDKRMKSRPGHINSSYRKTADFSIRDESTDVDNYSHFSTFALGGTDGAILWHHMPGDFVQNNSQENELPIHWKLSRQHTGKWHVGEVHWTKYQNLIINHLPHSWTHIGDTSFDVSDVSTSQENKRDKSGRPADRVEDIDKLVSLQDIMDLSDDHLIGLQYGGMRPHSHHEHITHPSIVVIHHDVGMELLSIQTGQPLSRIGLTGHDSRSLFVDVNGDGIIKEVRANFALKCQAEVSVFHPKPQAHFTGPLCESPFLWGGVGFSNLFSLPDVANENTHLAITPVAVKSVSKSYGVLNHLLGQNMASQRKSYDILFLTSTGRCSSYSSTGRPNWQVVLSSSWSEMAFKSEIDANFMETREGQIFLYLFQPTLTTITLQLYGKQSAALVIGWNSVTLVDLRDGFTLGQHSLPCQAVDRPVISDFNQDGLTDFIISCQDGYIGFTIQKSSTFLYTTTVAILVVLCIALLIWFSGQLVHQP